MKKTDDQKNASAGGRRLWIFDFDGTLSQLVEKRSAAVLHPEAKRMLLDLKADPSNEVAILSSRNLNDLCERFTMNGIYFGGGSGTEWRTPEECRITLGDEGERRLQAARENLLKELQQMAMLPGVNLEDKNWSVALHLRKAGPAQKSQLLEKMERLHRSQGLAYTQGHEVVEVQFLPEVNKAFGVRLLCRFLKFDPARDVIYYAGDDENDAIAMRWVTDMGGTAITVGEHPLVPGTTAVADPASLATLVRSLARLDEQNGKRAAKGKRTPGAATVRNS